MPFYACIAAIRIQPWITRTHELKLIRGASVRLRSQTAEHTVTKVLNNSRGVAATTAAGDIDGTVNLEAARREDVEAGARVVLDHLRTSLPGLQWVCNIIEAPGLLAAIESSKSNPAMPAPPRLNTVPFAAPCQSCGDELADAGGRQEGADCRARRSEVNSTLSIGSLDRTRFVATFEGLAKTSSTAQTNVKKNNHLAVVCADGNSIGRLFEEIGKIGNESLQQGLALALTKVTETALADTIRNLAVDGKLFPVLPHFVGGDDVMVSVSATCAWRFALGFGRLFDSGIRKAVNDQIAAVCLKDQQATTLLRLADGCGIGIGMAFHHCKYPFAAARELAAAAETAAKRSTNGGATAVAWLDVTAGQGELRTITLTDLASVDSGSSGSAGAPEFAWLLQDEPSSALSAVRNLVSVPGLATDNSRSDLRELLIDHSRRNELWGFREAVKNYQGQDLGRDVADALALLRWWQPDSQPQGEPK